MVGPPCNVGIEHGICEHIYLMLCAKLHRTLHYLHQLGSQARQKQKSITSQSLSWRSLQCNLRQPQSFLNQ